MFIFILKFQVLINPLIKSFKDLHDNVICIKDLYRNDTFLKKRESKDVCSMMIIDVITSHARLSSL